MNNFRVILLLKNLRKFSKVSENEKKSVEKFCKTVRKSSENYG